MVFNPKNLIKTGKTFRFSGNVNAKANECLCRDVICEFWNNFTFGASSLTLTEKKDYIFSFGKAEKLSLDGYDYSINITPDGICVYAESEKNLIRGFMTLLDRFKAVDADGDEMVIEAECCQIRDSSIIKNRMVHFCIFAETELWELQRFVRLCGALKFTHIVLEFWGMLKYDCLKELSWPNGFTKDEIRPIIKEANDLGLEVVPMFNHWGHAPAARVMHGKHVLLDQNPTLQTYFSEDGWCWDIRKPKVKALLRKIRDELIELCGEGNYFHIGCDEAYNFDFSKESIDFICDYINEISEEMDSLGRRVFVWGDMFLYRYENYNPKSRYTCNAPSAEIEEYFLNRLSKRIIIADWQYRAMEAPVETSLVFKKAGFDCILCPWDEGKAQIDSVLKTVQDESFIGYMHTTWHTLSSGMMYVAFIALGGFEDVSECDLNNVRPITSALLRKVMPINGDYRKAGWAKYDVGCRW